MGRESHDPTVVHSHSSIALLQERFRQLQRVKEMREERELLKLLAETKQTNHNPTTSYEPTRLFYHPELVVPSSSRSPPHVSLTLWPTTSEDDTKTPETPVSMSLSSKDHTHSLQASWKNVYDCDHSESDSGVDTSLHL
ncbi:hypothetical protein L6164_036014 [Bauhinia variegata]|uniref:Uncharacterized protein n=1 Tax=Bauhinia variegata TaxID=167791 RepID=A0ACB9KFQ1_BAUVA|nr:hypothetical protein L6164_036014 [Bauhinia variegata]